MFKELVFLKEVSVGLDRGETFELIQSLSDCNKKCNVYYRCNDLYLRYNEAERYSFPDKALDQDSISSRRLTGSDLRITVENRRISIWLRGFEKYNSYDYRYMYNRPLGNLWDLTCKGVPLKILKNLESYISEIFEKKVTYLVEAEEKAKKQKRIEEMKVLLLQKIK